MTTVLLLPPCAAGAADLSVCAVDAGLIAYLGGAWRHVNQCRACAAGKPCNPRGHVGCDAPQPEPCPHCDAPAAADTICSSTAGAACCGCCWIPAHQNGAC